MTAPHAVAKKPKGGAWHDRLEPDLLELVDLSLAHHYADAVAADFAALAAGGRADVQCALRRHLLPPLWRFIDAAAAGAVVGGATRRVGIGATIDSATAAAERLEAAASRACLALDRQAPTVEAEQLTAALRQAWVSFAAELAAPMLYSELPRLREVARERSEALAEAAVTGNKARAKLPEPAALRAEFEDLRGKGFDPLGAKHRLEVKYGVKRQTLNRRLDADQKES